MVVSESPSCDLLQVWTTDKHESSRQVETGRSPEDHPGETTWPDGPGGKYESKTQNVKY